MYGASSSFGAAMSSVADPDPGFGMGKQKIKILIRNERPG
jgi:hypothetical protein